VSLQEELRRRQLADMLEALPRHVARLDWGRSELRSHRRRSLRLLLRVAKEYSPWHRERLRDVDPSEITEDDLARIPPMSRDDLMEHWDDIVIYPGLERARVEAHLEAEGGYLDDAFQAVASSGSSGRRGIYVYDWDGWITSFLGCARWRLRNRPGAMGSRRPRLSLIGSASPDHISRKIFETFRVGELQSLPASMPFEGIVDGLRSFQPNVLVGFPSMLRELAKEVQDGGLCLRPAYVHCAGEPLEPGLRQELASTFGGRVNDGWFASEAMPLAQGCSVGARLHLNDDLVIVEPVEEQGRRTPLGEPSSQVYLTNLYNLALPLIRFEMDESVTFAARSCPCGSSFTPVDAVGGRVDDRFVYDDGSVVAAAAIDGILREERGVEDYQVVQTRDGAEVRLLCGRGTHLRALAQRVASALVKGGVDSPSVRVRRVRHLERGAEGKRLRFVPQAPAGA
jgi:phenylacetate-coenzyme A ligase PaaK-like adenylate-forming protein